jgi:alpha-beta hydrolase superfamily lysophospholipase
VTNTAPPKRGTRRRLLRWFGVILVFAFATLNLLAYFHAHSMMHFTRISPADRTHEPETLSILHKARVLLFGVKIPRPENDKTPADSGFAFETVNFAGARGLQLEAWRIRTRESRGTILLFHAYTSSKASLLPAAQEFLTLGHDALLVDFYGSGGSAGKDTSVGYHEADDVAAAFRFASAGETNAPVILYGVSMGAASVLRAIHSHGIRPAAAILECPFDRLLTTVQNRFTAMGLPSFPGAQLLVFWGGVQQGFNGFSFNPAEYARDVHCPVLLMHGGADARVKPAEVEHIVNNLNPASTYKLFPEVPHQSYVVGQAAEWRASVNEFLGRISASSQHQ